MIAPIILAIVLQTSTPMKQAQPKKPLMVRIFKTIKIAGKVAICRLKYGFDDGYPCDGRQ